MAWTIPELEILKHPRLLRQLKQARAGIHTTLAPLDVRVATSDEPVPFEEKGRLAYRTAKRGTPWGRAPGCAWFHVRADLRGLEGELALILDTDGEAVAYSDAGEVVGMATSRLTPIERHAPARAKTRMALTPELRQAVAPDGFLSLWLDSGFNGKLVQPFGIAMVRRLDLVRIDRAREAAYYDVLAAAYASLAARQRPPRRSRTRRARGRPPAAVRDRDDPGPARLIRHEREPRRVGLPACPHDRRSVVTGHADRT